MSPDRKPWLYMKRLDRWNPLASVRGLLSPAASDEIEPSLEQPPAAP
jgi:hypothetical protein